MARVPLSAGFAFAPSAFGFCLVALLFCLVRCTLLRRRGLCVVAKLAMASATLGSSGGGPALDRGAFGARHRAFACMGTGFISLSVANRPLKSPVMCGPSAIPGGTGLSSIAESRNFREGGRTGVNRRRQALPLS